MKSGNQENTIKNLKEATVIGKKYKIANYPGVYVRPTLVPGQLDEQKNPKVDYTFYITYRGEGGRAGKKFEEPVGTKSQGMNAKQASELRTLKKAGKELSNAERRNLAIKELEEKRNKKKLDELWDIYQVDHADRACHKGDCIRYNKHIQPFLGNKLVAELTTNDISNLRKKAESKHLAPQTVKHVIGLVRRILNHAWKKSLCAIPQDIYFEMPKVDNEVTEIMTDEQLAAYLKALDEEPDQDAASFLRLALYTGFRKGAIIGLRWDDINFEQKTIRLRGENAKNGKTVTMPVSDSVMEMLNNITPRSEYVFPGKNGQKRKDFRRIAKRVKEKAGLDENFRPVHGLRHTFASKLANTRKVTIYDIQKLLTHSSIKMTQRYAHLVDEALRNGSDLASELFEQKQD